MQKNAVLNMGLEKLLVCPDSGKGKTRQNSQNKAKQSRKKVTTTSPHNRGGWDITEMENSYYMFLLRFITVYYGYYGVLLRILRDFPWGFYWLWTETPQKAPETLIFEKNLEKSSRFIMDITEYYGYYGNCCYEILRNIPVRNISPPPPLPQFQPSPAIILPKTHTRDL